MPRNKRIIQSEFPYHVTCRTVNKQNFEINMQLLWTIFCRQLHFCSFAFKVEIQAFVLMNNHYHLIIRTPDSNLSQFMCYFNKEISKEINRISGKINQTFGGRFYSSVIMDPRYYLTVYRYVYRNPVQAGLCSKAQDYPYSSLNFVVNGSLYGFPVFDSPIVEGRNCSNNLAWINQTYSQSERTEIRKGLKKPIFQI